MATILLVILGIALGLASTLVILQYRRRGGFAQDAGGTMRVKRATVARPSNPFASVSIRPCLEDPCAAVLKLTDQRFLAVRAPSLPVPGCGQKHCGCRYIRHADRRGPGDRRDGFARFGGIIPNVGKDRRNPRVDRRKAR